jgi:hypothetical protein
MGDATPTKGINMGPKDKKIKEETVGSGMDRKIERELLPTDDGSEDEDIEEDDEEDEEDDENDENE